ncbi:type VI secretion system-associated FHA domain protein TagH [Nostoc sp. 3335mG]|nr:type VI secretion system-associated FHA domain protein TagH [Nostoc sp. 3335mG]
MPIILRIENVDSLPDGGALEFEANERGFDFGRDAGRAWTLPDPDRLISGRHCEVAYEGGAYWLTDVSRNGTYLNNSDMRMRSPHRLANGDRLQIGRYFIRVELTAGQEGRGAAPPQPQQHRPMPGPVGGDLWDAPGPAPAPAPQRDWHRPDPGPMREPQVLNEFFELPNAQVAGRQPQAYQPLPSIDSAALHGVPGAQFPGAFAPSQPTPPSRGEGADAFVATLATAAGMPPASLASRNPQELAREIGETLGAMAEHLTTLLRFRAAARRMTRSSERTQVSALGNNPLKFGHSHQEALDIMFGPGRPGYLRGPASVTEAMKNLTTHEVATYAAMQKALARLMEDLSPDSIEDELKGVGFGSKKGRAWDIFVTRWRAKEDRSENGMLDAFLKYFAQAYDEASKS